MATSSRRVLWKGAISFGLVHIPIALHSATSEQGIDFDWLDKRTMDPVGYKRINKKTGKEIDRENIVKGVQYEDGQYVIVSQDEIEAAYPKTTQTIEIEAFVDAGEIPFVYFERPYYISPINKGAKVYALLREVLLKTNKVGIAKVVIQTKQHLAVLVPSEKALVLNLLRWGDEIRSLDDLDLPGAGVSNAGISPKEMKMGEQLVEDMSDSFKPEEFTDSFREQILKLVDEKVKAGDTETVGPIEEVEEEAAGAKIYDLTELLQRSLKKGKNASGGKAAADDGDDGDDDDADEAPARKGASKSAGKASGKTASRSADTKSTAKASAKTAASKTAGKTAAKKTAAKKSGAKSTAAESAPAKRRSA
ncbi:Ku protein [Pigmentiphaga litoralis]|uniref:non-homologous end joining protein Ku n=1 Tax=Pigmentiphaga litoralis TaxID=516702 RepID=UPI003B43A121